MQLPSLAAAALRSVPADVMEQSIKNKSQASTANQDSVKLHMQIQFFEQ